MFIALCFVLDFGHILEDALSSKRFEIQIEQVDKGTEWEEGWLE